MLMGKVRDEAPARASKGAAKAQAARGARGQIVPFLTNLARIESFKPHQGWYARIWTAGGLAVLAAAGLYQLYEVVLGDSRPLVRSGVPLLLAAALGWIIWRFIQYPPFADFLIATEAEMNKVSWTTRDDLYRATVVVLVTVVLMSVYLFGVDLVWSRLLQFIGVLRFSSGDFGSQAG
jgi:preprotein translocase subunit SecE